MRHSVALSCWYSVGSTYMQRLPGNAFVLSRAGTTVALRGHRVDGGERSVLTAELDTCGLRAQHEPADGAQCFCVLTQGGAEFALIQ